MDVAGRPQASYESTTRPKAGRIASREPGAKSDLRYYEKLTGLLEQALRRVESLPSEAQDAIASQIIETLDDEEAWARRFRENPSLLRSLAREAREEHRRGETRALDELIG